MESPEELLDSIKLYEQQLREVRKALSLPCSDPGERETLVSLEANISELLELTKQSLDVSVQSPRPPTPTRDDNLDREYDLFKAELAGLESNESEGNDCNQSALSTYQTDIQEELEELLGSKCQAPYTNKLDVTNYFNALVLSTHLPETTSHFDQIQVKVMFTNPTEKEMVPCPFYLDGQCKFSDGKCNFSHGYPVPFSQLREFREPDFSRIKAGCQVLAKTPGSQLWVSTRIEDVLSVDTVSVRHQGVSVNIPLQDVFPLINSTHVNEDVSGDEVEEDMVRELGGVSEEALERSLMDPLGSKRKFGEWEQFTKGIGSKLMAKMGYVVGAGLGKSGEGMLNPVEATILPPGKSLDHCMNLREAAGGSKDLFSVERLQKKLTLKAQRRSAQMYKKKIQEEQSNVFNIINNMTSVVPKSDGDELSSRSYKKRLESSSERWLNVEKVKTEETMERLSRDALNLSNKLSTKKEGSVEYKHLAAKLFDANSQLETLQKKSGKLNWEINVRETKKKMAF